MISCLVASHNAAATVGEAVESVLCQSRGDLELIVIDDGSTDNTADVLAGFHDRRIVVHRQRRSGPAAARNRAMERSQGEFVACIDADDVWLPRKLELQCGALSRRADAAVVYGWTDFVDEQLQPLCPDDRAVVEGDVLPALLRHNFVSCGSNTMMRRQALQDVGGFDETLQAVEDWDLHARLAARYGFAVVREVVVLYRRSPRSLSSEMDLMEGNFHAACRKIFAMAPEPLQPLEACAQGSFYRYLLVRCAQSDSPAGTTWGKYRRLLRYAALAAWHDPAGLARAIRRR